MAKHVVRNPLDEVRGVLVLDVEHLLVNLLRRHAATEETRRGQVAAVTCDGLIAQAESGAQ